MDERLKEFLRACVDCGNFENNPILQDHMTPGLAEAIKAELAPKKIFAVLTSIRGHKIGDVFYGVYKTKDIAQVREKLIEEIIEATEFDREYTENIVDWEFLIEEAETTEL